MKKDFSSLHKKGRLIAMTFVPAILFNLFSSSAFGADWKLSAQASYETGKYGTDSRTNTLYLPLTLKRYFGRGDVSVTVPYIYQKSGNQVAAVDGTVFKIRQQAGPVSSNSGIGDIIVRGSYYLLSEGEKAPFDLSLTGKIKFPTADDSKGLGTGEFDEGVGVEFGKRLDKEWSIFADASYVSIGSPPGTDLRDRVYFDVGLSDKLSPVLTGSVFYEESTPLISGDPELRDVGFSVEYKAGQDRSVFAGALVGLTSVSPDWGLSAGGSIRF